MAEVWHYCQNQFLNVTKNNRKKAIIIANDHDSKLTAESADPDILALSTRFNPLKVILSTKYAGHIAKKGLYKGGTALVEQKLLDLSSTKIEDWDIQIQAVHKRDTPDYIAILPNYRIPFQSGGIDQRIEEVRALSERLAGYPALAAVKTDVDAFLTEMEDSRDTQQQKEEQVDLASDESDDAVRAVMIMMYKDLGSLMDKFGDEPTDVERFFEVSLLQSKPSEDEPFVGPIAGGETINLSDGGFDENTIFVGINTGTTTLKLCITDSASTACAEGAEILAGESKTLTAAELGYQPGWAFLNITNLDADNEGSYSVAMG